MRENTLEIDSKSYIKYRYPNVVEAFRLLPKIGVTSNSVTEVNEFEMAASIMESLEPYVIEVKYGGKALEWGDVLHEFKLVPHLQTVGLDIIQSISQQDEARKTRKK